MFVGFDPRFICIPRLLLMSPQEERLQESRRMQNVFIQVTPRKAALWGSGEEESKFIDELMKPFRGKNASTTLFALLL